MDERSADANDSREASSEAWLSKCVQRDVAPVAVRNNKVSRLGVFLHNFSSFAASPMPAASRYLWPLFSNVPRKPRQVNRRNLTLPASLSEF
jgi:hypothetical protein